MGEGSTFFGLVDEPQVPHRSTLAAFDDHASTVRLDGDGLSFSLDAARTMEDGLKSKDHDRFEVDR